MRQHAASSALPYTARSSAARSMLLNALATSRLRQARGRGVGSGAGGGAGWGREKANWCLGWEERADAGVGGERQQVLQRLHHLRAAVLHMPTAN